MLTNSKFGKRAPSFTSANYAFFGRAQDFYGQARELCRRTQEFASELRVLRANPEFCGRPRRFAGEVGVLKSSSANCRRARSFAGALGSSFAGELRISGANSRSCAGEICASRANCGLCGRTLSFAGESEIMWASLQSRGRTQNFKRTFGGLQTK